MKFLKVAGAVLVFIIGISCSRPEVTDAYWASNDAGSRLEGGADKGDIIYAYVTTVNAEGSQIRITIQEFDLIGGDEDCLDTFMSVVNESACVRWTVGEGDTSFLEGKNREYYFGAQLQRGSKKTVFSDHIGVVW